MAEKPITPSRRAMLAGLAAAPVAGLPVIAGTVASDDPIFAAIAEQRRCNALADEALVACIRIIEEDAAQDAIEEAEDAFSEKNKAYFDAEIAALSTRPMTFAGALALLAFLAEHLEGPHSDPGEDYPEPLLGAVHNALAVIQREAQS
ncbi:hypothetical protein [Methylocystis sp. B8]|uniref:hypothetical protein n=1 Tax=Methylocystis sp. B8 TaxID=544938 RepID=UPI0010FE4B78|nr:hypothetical protein [Methylocystis sp. B8]TLG77791.1 hypothetical protein FEV16_08175 [Methylocystis sp. B8]